MSSTIVQFLKDLWCYIERMNPTAWLVLFAVVVIIGVICLRGFGSRAEY